jgi:hypothetical protein
MAFLINWHTERTGLLMDFDDGRHTFTLDHETYFGLLRLTEAYTSVPGNPYMGADEMLKKIVMEHVNGTDLPPSILERIKDGTFHV